MQSNIHIYVLKHYSNHGQTQTSQHWSFHLIRGTLTIANICVDDYITQDYNHVIRKRVSVWNAFPRWGRGGFWVILYDLHEPPSLLDDVTPQLPSLRTFIRIRTRFRNYQRAWNRNASVGKVKRAAKARIPGSFLRGNNEFVFGSWQGGIKIRARGNSRKAEKELGVVDL